MWTSKRWQSCAVIVCCGWLFGGVFAGGNQLKSPVYPRSIKSSPRDPGGGGGGGVGGVGSELGNPAEWTMSKANLVAEFYSTEPAAPSVGRGRSQKSLFSFLSNNPNSNGNFNSNNNNISNNFQPRPRPPHPQQSQPQPHPPKGYNKQHFNGNPNLMASGSNPVPFEVNRHGNANNVNGNGGGGAYASPFRPIKFPQQNFIFPSASVRNNKNINNNDNNGYLPPRGPSPPQSQPPPPPPSSQLYWESNTNQIKGLVPPPMVGPLQTQNQPPPPHPPQSLYLPPSAHQPPPPPRVNQNQPPSNHRDQKVYQPPSKFTPPQYQAPPPHPQNSSTSTSVNSFHPSQQYLPPQTQQQQPQPPPQFKPAQPAPPQILDTYRNQAVYPAGPAPSHFQQPTPTQRPMVYVMANASSNPPRNKALLPPLFNFNHQSSPADPFTQYEIEPNSIPQFPPHPHPPPQQSSTSSFSSSTSTSTESQFHPHLSSSSLALAAPLSQVLAEANAKAGADLDKTIRFVVHKPEDEDVVKNAILEDAQNRYEDVRFVQGPTLKIQRKETVYLPPKKKTVVYILLKEPQIDTDVQVMSPQEDEPPPEVYITYQKSDGAVKTKHYSPKPIRQDDMKKYLDIEVESDSYGSSGEESRLHPRFSKSTSVSLSTSTHTLKKSVSVELSNDTNNANFNYSNNSALMANHRLTPLVVDNNRTAAPASTVTATPPTLSTKSTLTPLKMSPLLFATDSKSNSTYFLPYRSASKKGPRAVPLTPSVSSSSYRRFLRNPLIQCPTTVT